MDRPFIVMQLGFGDAAYAITISDKLW